MVLAPTVSVVDDDENARDSLAALIQSMSLDVACYASGREFLDQYSPATPGCVVLDLRMPQLNGLEVIDALSSRNIQVPVIMISGHGDIPAAVSAIKAGAVDFLEKPYRGATLIDSVRRAIDLDSRNRESQAERRDLLERFGRLTPDEVSVLAMTVDGKPDKAIALKLDLSLRTIQLRRASIMRKLHARSRTELIRMSQAFEFPPPDEAPDAAQNTG